MLEAIEHRSAEATVLELRGRVDIPAARTLETQLDGLIARGERRIVLDLTQLLYISSVGLRAVLMAAKALHAAGGRLVLCNPTPDVKRIFDIGFANVFEILPSRAAALAALR